VLGFDWVDAMDIDAIIREPESQTAAPAGPGLPIAALPAGEVSIRITYRAGRIGPGRRDRQHPAWG
jgi:hypothetical protein